MTKPFKITFCGDTSLGYYYLEKGKNKYPEAYQRLQNNPFSFFEGVAPLLEGSDEIIINLETVLTKNPGEPIEGKEYPGCDDPDVTIEILKKLGVTAVTLANNHAMDFGEKKLVEMIDLLRSNGIATIGAGRNTEEARKPYVITLPESGEKVYILNGMRARKRYIEYGFFAKKNKPGIASTNISSIKKSIDDIRQRDAKAKIIVIPHWQGIDYKDVGEAHRQWCEEILAYDSDMIIGHGSHKKDQVIEVGGKKAYLSLGNFIFNSPGRYAAKEVDPRSIVLSLSFGGPTLIAEDHEIITDNKLTDFNVKEAKRYNNSDRIAPSHLDFKFLSSVEGFVSFSAAEMPKANGVEYVVSEIKEGEFLLVIDEKRWSKVRRERSKQAGLTDKEIVQQAVKRGAIGFISERDFDSCGYPIIKVDNSRNYFLNLAKANRARFNGKVIAVTGTAGKSSTVAMLKGVLSELGENVLYPSGNTNTLYGVASLLSRLNSQHTCCIAEAALSGYARFEDHVGKHINPDISVITSLDISQPEITDSVEGTAFFKCRQIESLNRKGVSVFCADTPVSNYVDAISSIYSFKAVSYGETGGDFKIVDFCPTQKGSAIVKYSLLDGKLGEFEIKTPSLAMAKNSLAVMAVCQEMGYSNRQVEKLLYNVKKIKRVLDFSSVVFGTGSFKLIDDTKNATLSSLKESLLVASLINEKRSIAIIGDLVHLGDHKEKIYNDIEEMLSKSKIDYYIGYGKDIENSLSSLGKRYLGCYQNIDQVLEALTKIVQNNDVVLIKGSSRNTSIRLLADKVKLIS